MGLRAFIAAAAVVCAVSAAPSGSYCGSYMVVQGKITIKSPTTLAFEYDVLGDSSSCASEEYKYNPATGAVALPKMGKAGDCVGDLLRGNGVDDLTVSYDAAKDTVKLDASIATVHLHKC